jgi:hypothetical protein
LESPAIILNVMINDGSVKASIIALVNY